MAGRVLDNDRLLRALARKPVDRPPVWLMRQAGRYLPEYRALRQRAGSFLSLCKTPDLAAEATLQPLQRYPLLDAAIVFSDILTIPDALGLGLDFVEGQGPVFAFPLSEPATVDALPSIDVSTSLSYVFETVRAVRSALGRSLPLIGFSGSPWTLACYMIEGRSSRDFASAKRMAWEHPEAMEQLLDGVSHLVTTYLRLQQAAGADVLMLFDTWGGLLDPTDFDNLSLKWMRRIVQSLPSQVPVIVFSKGQGTQLPALCATGAQGLGLDWTVDLNWAWEQVGGQVALQGNLDPSLLWAPPDVLRERVSRLCAGFTHPGHVFNLGHGVTPQVDPEQVQLLLETVAQQG